LGGNHTQPPAPTAEHGFCPDRRLQIRLRIAKTLSQQQTHQAEDSAAITKPSATLAFLSFWEKENINLQIANNDRDSGPAYTV
jgi:hypothetical protein